MSHSQSSHTLRDPSHGNTVGFPPTLPPTATATATATTATAGGRYVWCTSPASPFSSTAAAAGDDALHGDQRMNGQSAGSTETGSKLRSQRRKTLMIDPPPASAKSRDPKQILSTMVAGVGSGFLASIICAPLDLVRTRLQVWGHVIGSSSSSSSASSSASSAGSKAGARNTVSAANSVVDILKEIAKKEGWQGWFRGLGTTLVTVPMFWGVYFPLYDETKRMVRHSYPQFNEDYPSIVHCGSAVFTGAVADVICNPFFVVRTRIQTEALHNMREGRAVHHSGMIQTTKNLYAESGGPRIFWRGMTANLLGLAHVAIQFPAYEALKKMARERNPDGMETPIDLLLASGMAKMGASLLSYPHEVLRSRMMDSRATQTPTLLGTGRDIIRSEGVAGLYAGLPVTLIRVVPNCCVTFVTYELLLRWSRDFLDVKTPMA